MDEEESWYEWWRDYQEMKSRGAEFLEAPRVEAYGTVIIFVVLYGDLWYLLALNRPVP